MEQIQPVMGKVVLFDISHDSPVHLCTKLLCYAPHSCILLSTPSMQLPAPQWLQLYSLPKEHEVSCLLIFMN